MNPEHTIPQLLYYLFFGTTAVVITAKFVLNNEWKKLSPKRLLWGLKAFIAGIVPIVLLMAATKLGGATTDSDTGINFGVVDIFAAAPYFAGSAFLAYILGQIGLNAELRALLLLVLSVILTMLLPGTEQASWELPVMGTIAGLLVWKAIENFLHKPESRLDDVLAPIVWLTTFYYSKVNMGEVGQISGQSLVLSTLTVAVFLRWVQPILVPNDNIYLKRLMLAITGGLLLLVLITRVLLQTDDTNVAILGGAGFLGTYLLQSLDRNVDEGPSLARGLKNILLVGIYTLAATRIFGMPGLLVLAATTVVAPIPGSALIAGFFYLSRVLLEGFVLAYNSNVTGINLMHPYTNAALYAGFLAVVVASVLIKDLKERRLVCTVSIAGIITLVAACNYFLHAEPTCSALSAIGIASVLIAMLAAALYPSNASDQENLIFAPMLGGVTAILTHGLIDLGNYADTEARVKAMCIIGFIMLCIMLVNHFVFSDRTAKRTSTANS